MKPVEAASIAIALEGGESAALAGIGLSPEFDVTALFPAFFSRPERKSDRA